MAKFVCLLLCLAILVKTGFSIKCYHCHSERLDGCLKNAGPKEQSCGLAAPGHKSVCYYKQSYDANKKADIINATCATVGLNANIYSLPECQQLPGIHIKECRICETDLCNSAPVSSTSLFALLCLPVMYIVTKFLL